MITTLKGLRRMLAKPVSKKEPITAEILKAMVTDASKHPTLANIRLTTACLLEFAGFLRFNELVNVRPCDLTFHAEMVKLAVKLINLEKAMRWSSLGQDRTLAQ